MNLSFSTRGWGDLSWEALLEAAIDMKFTGIEVYNLFKFPALTDRSGPFHPHKIAATVRHLKDLKLTIPCLDTSMDLSEKEENAEVIADMMRIAHDLQVPYVVGWASSPNEDMIVSNIQKLLPLAEELNVCLLIKTSGIYADTGRLRALLESFASDYTGALWDMHHPYRDFNESADTTIRYLRQARSLKRLRRQEYLQSHRRRQYARRQHDPGPQLHQLRRLYFSGMEARLDGRSPGPGNHLPPLRQLHEPV